MSCGAACARQWLQDQGIPCSEEAVRSASGFTATEGIYGRSLADGLNEIHPTGGYRYGSAPSQLTKLVQRAPFLAMLDSHWVIVDGETSPGVLGLRDPEPLPGRPSVGSEGTMTVADFEDAWARGCYQVVFR